MAPGRPIGRLGQFGFGSPTDMRCQTVFPFCGFLLEFFTFLAFGIGFGASNKGNPEENLKKYSCLVFSNTCNDIFDTEQQKKALVDYIHAGGSFVGIHSASDSEKSWPWYTTMVGGKFKKHPAFQSFEIKVINKNHPSTAMLPEIWRKEDECYYMNELNPNIQVLLAADLRTVKDAEKEVYPGRIFGDYFPLAWYHEFEGARVFYTALGHDSKDYTDPVFIQHLTGGILWALGENVIKKKNK